MSREKHIYRGLDRAKGRALEVSAEIDDLKWIIFSDHHRGCRDGADDFLSCEPTYVKALEYYLEKGYTLLLLGDVEEFWENTFRIVIKSYENVLDLEKQFYNQDKLYRIWGNHDDNWRFQGALNKHMGWLFPKLEAFEAINLNIQRQGQDLGEILFLHGHQGTLASERIAGISKFFVRYIWRNFQRVFKTPLSTPSKNVKLKSEHDLAMYGWASNKKGSILICGHTHQPVFMSLTHADKVTYELQELELKSSDSEGEIKGAIEKEIQRLRKLLDEIEIEKQGTHLYVPHRKPCYFNSGCCSFADGDITGLEIADGKIQLIKWIPAKKEKLILDSAYLHRILSKCNED